eukprot:c15352_g1_i1.p1 GENE.c15352_g1_i1~~c15352_g1_i1.p1  ORF type:complete len:289 (-),score=99.97 c15352_g1_i1:25-891(-)
METESNRLVPNFKSEYFDSGFYKTELQSTSTTKLTAAQVVQKIKIMSKSDNKHEKIYEKIADVIEGDRIDGDVLIAGGPDYIIEKVEPLLPKRLKNPIINCSKAVFKLLDQSEKQETNLWARLKNESELGSRLVKEFDHTTVGKLLKETLMPQPYLNVTYECIDWISQIDVKYSHQQVEKVPELETDKFKIVSICSEQDCDVVMYNMVFALDESNRWFLLTCVDFAKHGEAEAGHWHINRTPDGSLIEHWGFSGQVWHGSSLSCPIWWLLIPTGKKYHRKPKILTTIF